MVIYRDTEDKLCIPLSCLLLVIHGFNQNFFYRYKGYVIPTAYPDFLRSSVGSDGKVFFLPTRTFCSLRLQNRFETITHLFGQKRFTRTIDQ